MYVTAIICTIHRLNFHVSAANLHDPTHSVFMYVHATNLYNPMHPYSNVNAINYDDLILYLNENDIN
jgi:hypothetical protein